MEKISDIQILEFKYESREERGKHVKLMESNGYECSGQVERSNDPIMSNNRNYYWYAKFSKSH